jgi:hypothetical protein
MSLELPRLSLELFSDALPQLHCASRLVLRETWVWSHSLSLAATLDHSYLAFPLGHLWSGALTALDTGADQPLEFEQTATVIAERAAAVLSSKFCLGVIDGLPIFLGECRRGVSLGLVNHVLPDVRHRTLDTTAVAAFVRASPLSEWSPV